MIARNVIPVVREYKLGAGDGFFSILTEDSVSQMRDDRRMVIYQMHGRCQAMLVLQCINRATVFIIYTRLFLNDTGNIR